MKNNKNGIICVVAMLMLSGCASQSKNDVEVLQSQVQQLEDENSVLLSENESLKANVSKTEMDDPIKEDKSSANETNTDKTFLIGETITMDNVMELNITSCEWTDKVLPSNTSGAYSYLDDVNGETYVLFRGTVTNLFTETIDTDNIQSLSLSVNDKYKFQVGVDCEETDGTGFYGNPKPLQTLNVIIYSSVSDEVKNIFETGELTMNILSNLEEGTYYDESSPHETYVLKFDNSDFLTLEAE